MPKPDFNLPAEDSPDTAFDVSLRPPLFEEFTGQAKTVERLQLMVEAARQRGEALQHILLSGPPGLGKTTLAYIIGNAMGVDVKSTSGPGFSPTSSAEECSSSTKFTVFSPPLRNTSIPRWRISSWIS